MFINRAKRYEITVRIISICAFYKDFFNLKIFSWAKRYQVSNVHCSWFWFLIFLSSSIFHLLDAHFFCFFHFHWYFVFTFSYIFSYFFFLLFSPNFISDFCLCSNFYNKWETLYHGLMLTNSQRTSHSSQLRWSQSLELWWQPFSLTLKPFLNVQLWIESWFCVTWAMFCVTHFTVVMYLESDSFKSLFSCLKSIFTLKLLLILFFFFFLEFLFFELS